MEGFQGVFHTHREIAGSGGSQMMTSRHSILTDATGTVRFDHWDAQRRAWIGTVAGTVQVNHKLMHNDSACRNDITIVGDGPLVRPVGAMPLEVLLFFQNDGTYYLQINYASSPATETTAAVCVFGSGTETRQVAEDWYPDFHNYGAHQPIPASAGRLTFSGRVNDIGDPGWGILFDGPNLADSFPFDLSWDIQPIGGQDDELTFEPLNYQSWIPEGARSADQWGNSIRIRAELQKKGGGPPKTRAVRFYFNLDASAVPGVAMNYPLQEPSNRPDLGFPQDLNPEHAISNQGRHAETPGDGLTAEAAVGAYDWGAWGSVRVSALLDDGRTITGTYQGANTARLPHRAEDSKIADAWKDQTGFSGADDEDNDELPAGDGHGGDGLTAYEEYRGFYENGTHIRTRPARKDLFILDLIGARAKPAIALFAQLTGLQVHHRLKEDEMLMFPEPHVINLNNESVPHRVDQHGVVLVETAQTPYPQAWSKTYTTIGTPKTVDLVGIPPTLPESIGKGPIDYLHKAIAHELLHSVGVWHHGESDYKQIWRLKLKPGSDKPSLWERTSETFIRVLKESGEDVGTKLAEALDASFTDTAHWSPLDIEDYHNALQWSSGFNIFMDPLVGEKGGQHSGNDDCLMRYEYAVLSQSVSDPNTYYYLDDQRRGRRLCDSPAGTGNNDPGLQPQSRHGDASPNRGGCLHMICVNDAIDHPAR